MKAGLFFTGSGPIVVLTSFDSITDSRFIEKLKAKGIQKFLAYEIPVDEVKEKYGMHFNVILGDLKQTDVILPQKSRHGQAQSFTFCFSYSAGQRYSSVECLLCRL